MDRSRSKTLYQRAQQILPGGVNSPVRNFGRVGGNPVFMVRGDGSHVFDADGNEYIDYLGSWGPLILGHSHPGVVEALRKACGNGTSFGMPTEMEIKLAELVQEAFPSIEMIRMVNSGTEATMSAARVARGYTGRDIIVKFEAGYHGHGDGFLIQAGSGAATFGIPDSPGVPNDVAKLTMSLPYNDTRSVQELFRARGDEIACVIVEPIAGNMGLIPPRTGFLETLRAETEKHGSVLIFDEVMTGFRVALGGAQSLYQIEPDLTTIGKVIGGGLPVGAFGGKTEIMELIAPLGGVYQAGTLAGSPLAVAAGLAMLNVISKPGFHDELAARTAVLLSGLQERADQAGIPFTTTQVGAMFGCFFTEEKNISHFSQVMSCDTERFKHYFHSMLDNGVYLAPSAFEAGFVSSAHGDKEIQLTLIAAEKAFSALPK